MPTCRRAAPGQRRHDEHRAPRLVASAAISAAITARGSAMRAIAVAHGEREHKSDDAEGADLVIAHDRKAAFVVSPARPSAKSASPQ
jgi:hypothetical protein